MIVLHAAFCERQLLVWGETPADVASIRRRRRPAPDSRALLIYDAGRRALTEALADCHCVNRQTNFQLAVVWVPTVNQVPVASSSLIAEPLPDTSQSKIEPWLVTALCLDAEHALNLLGACAGKQLLKPGAVVGADLEYWTRAMRLAGSIVTRQQFLPDLREESGTYRGLWLPVIVGPDAERLRKLAEAMPAAARALTLEASAPPDHSRQSLLGRFVDEIVDYTVRFSGYAVAPSRLARSQRGQPPPSLESLHDQWLVALRSLHPTMKGDPAQLAEFVSQVHEWQRPARLPSTAPFRLCFRLEEPEEPADDDQPKNKRGTPNGRGTWFVRYLLQSARDPSLLIPAKDAWKGRGRKADFLQQPGFDAREYLLISLGQASGLSLHVEASLKTATPEGYRLDAAGAHEFLSEKAPVLEQSGFGVMLPAWWTRKGTKLRLTARAHVKSPAMQGGGLSLDELVHFEWEVALGTERLTLAELEALANLKAPLVKVRGQWVQMSAEEIQAALDFWKKKSSGSATAREILRMALGGAASAGSGPMALEGVTATGWIEDLLKQLEGGANFEELPAPEDFQGTLRPYQARGYSWLCFLQRWGLGACLADDMGLGKTIQALALILRDQQCRAAGVSDEPGSPPTTSEIPPGEDRPASPPHPRPVLLICPTSVVGNWHKEAARFAPCLPVMVHHGVGRTRGSGFREEAQKHALVISSYALLQRDFETLKEVSWSGLILDEAQNIKNPETKQARAARGLQAEYRAALTGTPVENNVGDLWSLMEFLNPGLLGTQSDFKKTFFLPIQVNRDPEAVERLKRLTGPFILRRLKTDKSIITDLPEKMEMKVFCTLTKEQASLYAAVVKEASKDLETSEGIQRKGVVLATLSKLKQVCNHPAQFLGDNSAIPGRSGKLARLTEMLEEILEVGERALIFSQFAEMGEILRRHLQESFGQEVLFLHGAVPKKQRDVMVERFQRGDGSSSLFILSLKAGGTGLNLTRASHVFHFDRWWNPAVENQATDRAFRIGQSKNVQVHKFICVGTLEERIDEMIERKKEVAAGVVGTGEGWLTELSTAELKEIFALRKEAVEE